MINIEGQGICPHCEQETFLSMTVDQESNNGDSLNKTINDTCDLCDGKIKVTVSMEMYWNILK